MKKYIFINSNNDPLYEKIISEYKIEIVIK